jgi:hypothetical protein
MALSIGSVVSVKVGMVDGARAETRTIRREGVRPAACGGGRPIRSKR